MVFYRNVMGAAFEIAPDDAMEAVRDEVVGFQMPGAGMADFTRNSVLIAKAGIYDLRLHLDDVLMPVLRYWKVLERTGFGPRGEKARDEVAEELAGLEVRANRFVEQRERARARAER
jgi:acyl-[acyl-carrier-protein] desaturase